MTSIASLDVRCLPYELSWSLDAAAAAAAVWDAMTSHINEWWLPDFHMLGAESVIRLDLRAGGLLVERNGAHELLWYTVLAVTAGSPLDLAGNCSADFGGTHSTLLSLKLEASKQGTRLTLRDSLFGHVTEAQARSLQAGWNRLFGDGLKPFVERPR